MKRLMFGLMAIVLSGSVCATTYYVTDGYFGTKTIENEDTLIMTGGGGYNLTGRNNSLLDIRNTSSPVVDGESGIVSIDLNHSSHLDFSGGCVAQLSFNGSSTAVLSGGQIAEIWSYYFFPADASHITVYCQPGWTYSGGYLSGLWFDNTAFNIKLVTASGYSDLFSNMTIIPEPATMLLLAVGGLFLKRK